MTDPTVNRLAAEVEALRSRVVELENQRRRRHRFLAAVLVLGATAAWGQLVSFTADQPAQAAQVNANFTQLKSWIEAKVGTLAAGTGRQAVDIQGPLTANAGAGNTRAAQFTATAAFREPIVDVRHENQQQGVGIGWATVFSTGTLPDVNLTLSPKGNARVFADSFQANQEYGYSLSCGESAFDNAFAGYAFCCRINTYNGETTCALATNGQATTWGAASPYPGMGAATPGRYALSCAAGAPGANYPFCCRINQNTGSAYCGQGSSYALGTTGNVTIF